MMVLNVWRRFAVPLILAVLVAYGVRSIRKIDLSAPFASINEFVQSNLPSPDAPKDIEIGTRWDAQVKKYAAAQYSDAAWEKQVNKYANPEPSPAVKQQNAARPVIPVLQYPVITQIYWSDGDSGRLNGNIKFRLNSVDAPETGKAKCERERELGYESKAWMVGYTKNSTVTITRDYGLDRYGRLIVDLSVNGLDVGLEGTKLGHLAAWPHKGTRALAAKPVWCH